MTRFLFFGCCCWLCLSASYAQPASPVINIRLGALLVPFTPLLSIESRLFGSLTVQGETNLVHTHGLNLKYYLKSPLEKGYVFIGSAFVQNRLLRQDGRSTTLPYMGWGYAHIFGQNWVFDGRIGVGSTINADQNGVYPIIKAGVGKRF